MKRIMINLVMLIVGFIGGILTFLKWISKCEGHLLDLRKELLMIR